jgi:hypothetical protein
MADDNYDDLDGVDDVVVTAHLRQDGKCIFTEGNNRTISDPDKLIYVSRRDGSHEMMTAEQFAALLQAQAPDPETVW